MKTSRFFVVWLIPIMFMIMGCHREFSSGEEPARWVDPFIGTAGHGHTYPGATLPFGMVQLSPQTRLEGWDGCSGYHYSDSILYGFAHTALSGTGCSDYGDILLMPVVGKPVFSNSEYSSPFLKEKESACPGYYKVFLEKPGVWAELTATPRVGYHRYTFPPTPQAQIIIDLQHRDKVVDSWIEFVGDRQIRGLRRSSNWAQDMIWYFYMEFSRPFVRKGIAINDSLHEGILKAEGTNIKAYVGFDTQDTSVIEVKVALSPVDAEGAYNNLKNELPAWGFEETKNQAYEIWNKELAKIKMKGGTKNQLTIFYTALYHAMLQPNIFMDVDRRYRGIDRKVDTADDFDNYTVFSLWDTYRAWHPLMTIIDSGRTVNYIRTMLNHFDKSGALPVWELAGNETWCMIGNHSIPVIADAWVKGIRGFDPDRALEAMIRSVNSDRFGMDIYRRMGCLLGDKEHESVSKTLEYAYDDWCIAQIAKDLGNDTVYSEFIKRAQFYKNLYDPSTGFIRPKINGGWLTPFDATKVDWNYTEANAWQYNFHIPQDVNGHIALMGSDVAYLTKLDELFNTSQKVSGRDMKDISGLIGQYAHGNEPSHHVAYLFSYAGQPWKTQEKVRQIMDDFYTNAPDGLIGNEDCGQMSAWLILSAMGFYPVTPGSDIYVLGTPWFKEMEVQFENGKTFTITTDHPSPKSFYVQKVLLNGQSYDKSFIRHQDIKSGSHLHFKMGKHPNETWGNPPESRPKSIIQDHLLLPMPYINSPDKRIRRSIQISMGAPIAGSEIYYTLDGTMPDKTSLVYSQPIQLTESAQVIAIALHPEMGFSYPAMAEFVKIDTNLKIRLLSNYHPNYSAGGPDALIDGLRGPDNWRLGGWQGYQGTDFEAIVDMGSKKTIHHCALGCLQDAGSWIWMPSKVEFFLSDDGKNFQKIGEVAPNIATDDYRKQVKDLGITINRSGRYIKVRAINLGTIPSWHPGAGDKTFIFVDEIVVK
ncbi:MAG TPA: GH92 family glycosyl hydrolase [Bacteroidales bacterium]|nr:GH92 family glycosyl hydrolase [Bacteroidales bacterium]MDI9574093.1 GH92 family glycosyl hydrolase [Bacteroidota bacterium]OQC58810.1 MAG: Glycosyl hydrolase family 92 [Bacteroidetes bacterium ADurb.Bin012]MBP9512626.1 GH92 family glycosyl hydrolase [Bacteroidales bacterium]MBP9589101.1 GH92 family glycosyl hydrolase [Bacteroidales bacterium]